MSPGRAVARSGRRRTRRRTAVVVGGAAYVAGKHSGKKGEADQATAPADDSITAQLEELASLQKQGLITQAEYDAKKADILAS